MKKFFSIVGFIFLITGQLGGASYRVSDYEKKAIFELEKAVASGSPQDLVDGYFVLRRRIQIVKKNERDLKRLRLRHILKFLWDKQTERPSQKLFAILVSFYKFVKHKISESHLACTMQKTM